MADGDQQTPDGEQSATPTPTPPAPDAAATPAADTSGIKPSMSETEIRAAGLAIDVPFESGQPKPERLKYADLGMPWTPPPGWPPETGQPQQQDDDQTASGDATTTPEATPPDQGGAAGA